MLTKFVVLYVLTSHSHTWFFFYFGELHVTFHYTSYYSFLWLWLYVCSSLLFVAVLVAMQKMHVEIECVYWINRLL